MTRRLLRHTLILLAVFTVGFSFGQTNSFQWVNGAGTEQGQVLSVAYSLNGDCIYSGGSVWSNGNSNFPVSVTPSDQQNGFLVKCAADGTPIWGFDVGNNGIDEISAIAVDNSGNIVVAGSFEGAGANFEGTSGGSSLLSSTGGKDVFIAKYNPSGVLMWLQQGTSSGDDYVHDIDIDNLGNIYIAGSSTGLFSYNGNTISSNGALEAYGLKINSLGVFQWMRSFGSPNEDSFTAVTTMGSNVYFGGYFRGGGSGLVGILLNVLNPDVGKSEMILVECNASSGTLLNSEFFGGVDHDEIHGLTNDGTSIYLTGHTKDDFTIGSDNYSNSNQEIITAKLNVGLIPVWSTTTTHVASGTADGACIQFAGNNKLFVGGGYSGALNTSFALTPATSDTNGIVLVFDANSSLILDQTVIGGSDNQYVKSFSSKSSVEMYLGGRYRNNTSFPPFFLNANNAFDHPYVGLLGCTPDSVLLSGDSDICSGQSTDLTFTFSGVGPFDIGLHDGTSETLISGVFGPVYTYTVTPASNTTYTISSFNSSSSCGQISSGTAIVNVISAIGNNIIAADTTICSGETPFFTGSLPTGSASPTYLWEFKAPLQPWQPGNNINTLQNYTSVPINSTVQYRRIVTVSGCQVDTSNVVVANVVFDIFNNNISGDQASCGSFDPISFSTSNPNGGGGSYTYTWETDTDSNFVAPTTVGTIAAYNAPFQSQTQYFRRIVETNVCTDTSDFISVVVDPVITNNTISSSQIICGPGTPAPLSGDPAGGGTGTYNYNWQSSPDEVTWTNVGNTQNYAPGVLSVSTYYRRIVSSGVCDDTSNTIKVEVNTLISDNTISYGGASTICTGTAPSALIGSTPSGGNNTTYTYLWEVSSDNIAWTNASGINNTINYNPPAQTSVQYYRRKVSSGVCADDTSNVIQINVYPPITNNSIFTDQTICANTTPNLLTGTTPTGGNGGAIAYQWLLSLDNSNFISISGANSIDYQPTALTATTYFRRDVSIGGCDTSYSDKAVITVEPAIANNIISADQTWCGVSTANTLDGSPATGGTGSILYNWFESTDSITWTNVGITEDYTPGTVSLTTYYFRTAVSGACSIPDTSNVVTIFIESLISGNTISHPGVDTICTGTAPNTINGSTPTGGDGSGYVYYWEVSDDSVTWVAASGTNNTSSYSPPIQDTVQYFRRTVTSGICPSSESNVIEINVYPPIANNFIFSDTTICANTTPNLLTGTVPTGGDGGAILYVWQSSTDNITFINIPASSTINYQPGVLTSTTYFRRRVERGLCGMNWSDTITITVEPAITNNSISADQLLCGSSTASALVGTTAIGGTGTMTYQWFESTDSLTWTSVATTEDFNPGIVSQTTYYFRTVVSGACNVADTSNVVTIIVESLISGNTITADHNVCIGAQPDLLQGSVASGGVGTITYSWLESTDSLTWVAASGSPSGTDFLLTPISDTTWYIRLASSGSCPSDTSNVVKVSVEDSVDNNILNTPPTICSNDASGVITGTLPINGNGIYNYEWEKSLNDTLWSPIASSNTQNYAIGGITTNTYFRRIVTSGECGSDTSASVLQVVNPFITTNNIGSSQTICNDSIPNLLFGTVQTPGTFGFSWQESTDGLNFVLASGTYANASYQAGNLISNTYYRRIMKSGACPNDTSNIVWINVLDPISNNSISMDTTVCSGTSGIDLPGSVPIGGDGNYLYTWESSIDGTNYSTALGLGSSNSQGFTTGTLTQTTYFRRIVYSAPCSKDSIISNVVTITVQAALSPNTISADQILCGDYNVSPLDGSSVTGGSGIPNYQWQSSADLSTWLDVAITEDYSPGTITDTIYFRRLVNSGACLVNDTSDTLTMTYLDPIAVNFIGSNDTICIGTSPASLFGLSGGGGDGVYSYAWEQSTDSVSWSVAVGVSNTTQFDPDPLLDTTYFRLLTSSSVCPVDTSNSVIIVVEDSIENNTISIPGDVCASSTSDSLFGSFPAGGNGVYTFIWQVYDSTLTTPGWVNAPGTFSNQDYAMGQLSDSAYYRRIVLSGQCGSDTSAQLLVAVQPTIDTNTIFQDQFICMNSTPQLLTGQAPSGSGFLYFWESSTDGVAFSIETSGLSMPDFQPGNLDSTNYYRRIIFSGACGYDTSNIVTVTVWDTLSVNVIQDDTTVCFNDSQITLNDAGIVGGSGSYTYLWEESTDGVVFATPTVNFTSADYTTGVLTQTMYYRRRVTDVNCVDDTLFSNIVTITVHPQITHNYSVEADTVCIGDDVNVQFLISGDAPYSITYHDQLSSSNPSNILSPGYDLNFTPTSSGLIILDTVYDANGCFITPADTFSYRVVAYPIVDLGNDTTVCDKMIFTPAYGSGVLEFNSATLGQFPNTFPQSVVPSVFGTHEFVLIEDVENCVSSDTVLVTFEESIGNVYAGNDQTVIISDSTQLEASGLLANQTGYWTLISGGGNFADTLNPQTMFLDLISGITILEWTVEQNVCPSVSDQVILNIENLLIPTGFSPNNDGDNDYLEVAGRENINTIRLQVYDRWGGLVFEDKDYQNDWAGTTLSGDDLPEDTYFVVIDLGEKGVYKSYLLIRR